MPIDQEFYYEGSGGAYNGYVEKFRKFEDLGAGGGIIILNGIDEIQLDGSLLANGQKFQNENLEGSGGSGGYIFLKANFIKGKGIISTQGGDSDENGNNGEGSGGVIHMQSQSWDNQEIQQEYFVGEIIYQKGIRNFNNMYMQDEEIKKLVSADDGIFIPQICPSGYQANNKGGCQKCNIGQYKNFLQGNCKNVTNIFPISAAKLNHKQNIFESFQGCYQICNDFDCDPAKYYVLNIISFKGILYIIFYLFVICLGYVSRRFLRMQPKKIDSIPIQYVKYDFDDQQFSKECRNSSNFQYKDLLYHKYRFQIYGNNNVNSFWCMQTQIPENTEFIFDNKEFKDFAQKVNKILKWKKFDIIIIKILQYIYYPLYWFFLLLIQKKTYKKIKKFIDNEQFPRFIIGLTEQEQKYIIMKISKSDDYSLCFLDIFNYQKINQKYFNIILPTIIHFSGEGNYLKPYYINIRDHFLQSLFYACISRSQIKTQDNCNIDVFCDNYNYHRQNGKQFELFIAKLNKYTNQLDFNCPIEQLIARFTQMIEYINKINEKLFYKFGLKVYFLIIEIPLKIEKLKNFEQKITLFESTWEEEKLKEKIKQIQEIKLYQKKTDIKLSLYLFSENENPLKIQQALQTQLEINNEQEQLRNFSINNKSKSSSGDCTKIYENKLSKEPDISIQQTVEEYMQNIVLLLILLKQKKEKIIFMIICTKIQIQITKIKKMKMITKIIKTSKNKDQKKKYPKQINQFFVQIFLLDIQDLFVYLIVVLNILKSFYFFINFANYY
ncbi:hypothetical protein IMG5_118070 [Ichthyophthirius multifiliis]|uniref:Uncharacterized protein n=1 Tax=Ichthyophthirius multifiliis TaxID=5932 RepID=G0QUN6_ICHMU|nr:hypothetical protein IMG5_118070 [Ichthyophthirius multifiliis]EGR31082.1 hypothetical protein IMG5_118070 [Ichthyophthirius multifiliis]|eukprot:XP_004034568.1 hypothetical protein IMG5_118070 [Ichthyophthirius multifiliis]